MPRSTEISGTKSRFRARIWLLLTLAAVFLIATFIFPIVFELRVDVPAHVQFGSASSMMFQISNQNLTPLTDVQYRCEISKLTLLNGSAVNDANVLNQGSFRRIPARRAVLAHCQTGYLIAAPVRTVEYTVTISYRASPWPQQRKRVARISAQVNGKGEVTGWKLD